MVTNIQLLARDNEDDVRSLSCS